MNQICGNVIPSLYYLWGARDFYQLLIFPLDMDWIAELLETVYEAMPRNLSIY